jgi:peptidoglycan/LPS O-acetylase OafA/YrhL
MLGLIFKSANMRGLTNKENNAPRFLAIDGLRGIAAMGVVFYHLYGNLKLELSDTFPPLLIKIFNYGYLGVPIFFVISGLVISISIGGNRITKSYALSFILRRSLRLDPTYWAAILFSLILLTIKNHVTHSAEPYPSESNVFAHMFYLQDILGVQPLISVVFWTLCLEVQFYLFYLFSLWLFQKIRGINEHMEMHSLVLIALGVYSILLDRGVLTIDQPGLFFSNWHYFLLGVLVGKVIRADSSALPIFFGWILIEITSSYFLSLKPYQVAGIISAVGFFVLWKTDSMNKIFVSPVVHYFGKISYPLYLIHPDVGWKVISLGKKFLGQNMSSTIAVFLFLFAIFVSVTVAHMFHLAIEKPSLNLANRLKRKRRDTDHPAG